MDSFGLKIKSPCFLTQSLKLSGNISVILIILILIQTSNQDTKPDSKIVTLKYGKVQGMYKNLSNLNLQSIQVFLGIPYASPPLGKLRFMPPVTSDYWEGVKQAHTFAPVCPQKLPNIQNITNALKKMTLAKYNLIKKIISGFQNQSEDCLYLNLYVPIKTNHNNSSFPVMMFIHGESYEWSSGSIYDGSILASYGNVIVVTINYRLGVFGFFSALDGSSWGNFGLMDQVAALHWIQENIANFGGDNKNVTIFGHGHGATCVNLLMLSPMAKGLFHRSILQSGSSLSSWAMANNGAKYSRDLAQSLSCYQKDNPNFDVLNCLRSKSVEELISVNFNTSKYLSRFGPTVDGIVIPNDPFTLMNEDHSFFGTYDLLFGVTKFESYNLFSAHDEQNGISHLQRDKILRTLVQNLFSFNLQEIYLTILNEYTNWNKPISNPFNIFESLLELLSDALVVGPAIKTGLLHSQFKSKTYFYHFAHSTQYSDYCSKLGSIHGEDMFYVFGLPLFINKSGEANFTESEVLLSKIVMTYWTNFAKYGDPNIYKSKQENAVSYFEPVSWPIYDGKQQKYLSIALKQNVKSHYHAHRLSYWFSLLPKLHVQGTASFNKHNLLNRENPFYFQSQILNSTISSNHLLDLKQAHIQEMALIYHQNFSQRNSFFYDKTQKQNKNITFSSVNSPDKSALDNKNFINNTFSMIMEESTYSTALKVTIAIGFSLLILNILVFAVIFFQRDRKSRRRVKSFEMPVTLSHKCIDNCDLSLTTLSNNCSCHGRESFSQNFANFYNISRNEEQNESNQFLSINVPCQCHLYKYPFYDSSCQLTKNDQCTFKNSSNMTLLQERSNKDQLPIISNSSN